MASLLVTNDFPPKTGGIQSYLWELWRRLPPDTVSVLTTPHAGAAEFDRGQAFAVERSRRPVLLPTPATVRWIRRAAADAKADLIVLDPALPLGMVGPRLGMPYAVVVHGAELTVPAHVPVVTRSWHPSCRAPRASSPPAPIPRPRRRGWRGRRCRS